MNQQNPEELYNYHFDTLNTHGESRARLIETDERLPEDSTSLFTIVRWLWQTLQPVAPSPMFQDELLQQLVSEYKRQRVQQQLGFQQAPTALRPIAWILPLVVGTASLLGMYAFWRRTRHTIGEDTVLAA